MAIIPAVDCVRGDLDTLTAAVHEPLSYPGTAVSQSSLLVGDRLLPLAHTDFCSALSRLGVVPMAERTPVLAVGSNGSAGRLLAKFGIPGTVIPILPVRVAGLRQGFAAGVSRRGYVPFAPVADPDARTVLRLMWLDPHQLRSLDETEPSYTRIHFDNDVVVADLYRSRFKVLREPDGAEPMAIRDQASLFAVLSRREWFGEVVARWVRRSGDLTDPAAIAGALAAHEDMRLAVRQGFVDDGLVCDDGL